MKNQWLEIDKEGLCRTTIPSKAENMAGDGPTSHRGGDMNTQTHIDTYKKADDAGIYILGLLNLLKKEGCLSGGADLTPKGLALFKTLVAEGFTLDREQIAIAYAPFVVEVDREARGVPVPEYENEDGHAIGLQPINLVMEARGQIVTDDGFGFRPVTDDATTAAKTEAFDGVVDLIVEAQFIVRARAARAKK
jgi:hypothetical protein